MENQGYNERERTIQPGEEVLRFFWPLPSSLAQGFNFAPDRIIYRKKARQTCLDKTDWKQESFISLFGVLVHFACLAITNIIDWEVLLTAEIFTVLERLKSRIQAPAELAHFLVHRQASSFCVLSWKKEGNSRVFLIRALIPFIRAPT